MSSITLVFRESNSITVVVAMRKLEIASILQSMVIIWKHKQLFLSVYAVKIVEQEYEDIHFTTTFAAYIYRYEHLSAWFHLIGLLKLQFRPSYCDECNFSHV